MSVKHAVLGLLIEQPGYPYDVMLRLRERLPTWQATTSVNHAFDRLEDERVRYIRKIPGTNWYEATPAGRAYFEAWLRESLSPDAPPLRSELLMKVGFPGANVELLERWYKEARAQEQWCINRTQALAEEPADLEALAERDKEVPVLSPVLMRDAESIYLNGTIDYLALVMRELRRVVELRTGRPMTA